MSVRVFVGRRGVVYGTVLAVLAGVPLAAQAAASRGPSASASPSVSVRSAAKPGALSADEVSALSRARASGRPVQVASAGSATQQVFADPNGSMTVEEAGLPRWVKQGSSWVEVDASLVRESDGSLSPRTMGTAVRLSDGGTAPLARLSTAAGSLSLTWPSRLPVPAVSGSTALYRDVLPGVDLQVTVTVSGGLDETLIVKDAQGGAQAQAASEDLGLSVSPGLVAKVNGSGALTVTEGRSGSVVFSSPTPLAWDSTGPGSSAQGPGRSAVRAKVAVRLDGHGERLSTAAGLLRGKDVHYPVFIDPQYTTGPAWQNYGWVESEQPTGGQWDTGTPGVGYDGTGVERTYWQTAIPSVLTGATVVSATLGYEVDSATSASSTADTLDLYQCAPISGVLSWDNQPTSAAGPVTDGFTTTSTAPDLSESFDVTGFVQDEVNAGATSWMAELANSDEGASANANFVTVTGYPSLTITYDPTPSAVYGVQLDPGFYPADGQLYTSSLTPTLESSAEDGNGAALQYQFQVLQNGVVVESGASAFTAQGGSSLAQWQVTSPLTDATTYQVVARAYDGTVYGSWSSPYTFTTDVAAPAAPGISCPGVSANGDTVFNASATTCTFTDTQTTLNGYTYSLTGPSGAVTWAWSGDGTATIDPADPGPYTLTVWAQNDADTDGPSAGYSFTLVQAPEFTSASSVQLTAGAAGTYSVTTGGYPVAALTESGTLPTGVTFTDNGDGTATLAGTPAQGATGSYPVTLHASNGVGTAATQTLTVLVTGAPPPAPAVSCADFPAGQWTATGSSSVSCSFSDTSTQVTGYAYTVQQDTAAASSGTTSGSSATIDALDPGIYTLTVRATESGGVIGPAATYAFGIGSGAVLAPTDQSTAGSSVTLQAAAPSGYSQATFLYRLGTTGAFKPVPTAHLAYGCGCAAAWPTLALTGPVGAQTSQFTWAITTDLGTSGTVQIEAVFSDPSDDIDTTPPVTVTLE